MLKHILVAVDDSDSSFAAYEKAAELARELHASLTALEVVEPNKPRSQGLVESYRARSRVQGIEPEIVVHEGSPAQEIYNATTTMRWDVLVIGTHARHGLERLRIGSVAEDILRRSEIPVLVVRRPEKEKASLG